VLREILAGELARLSGRRELLLLLEAAELAEALLLGLVRVLAAVPELLLAGVGLPVGARHAERRLTLLAELLRRLTQVLPEARLGLLPVRTGLLLRRLPELLVTVRRDRTRRLHLPETRLPLLTEVLLRRLPEVLLIMGRDR